MDLANENEDIKVEPELDLADASAGLRFEKEID